MINLNTWPKLCEEAQPTPSQNSDYPMDPFIKEVSLTANMMEGAFLSTQISNAMKVNSKMGWNMGKESIIILKVNYTLAIGSKIKNMEKDCTSMKMAIVTMETFKITWNMGKDGLIKKMEVTIWANFFKTTKTKQESILKPSKIKNICKSMIKESK